MPLKKMGTKKEKHRKPLVSQRFSWFSWWAPTDSNRGPSGYELGIERFSQYVGLLYNAPESL